MTEVDGLPHSYWIDSTGPGPVGTAPPAEIDTLVLGAGIAGLTTAYRLAERGRPVAVVEARDIAAGTSGHTTAKVTVQHGLIYDRLARRFGEATAQAYGESQRAAQSWLAEQAQGIPCDWEARDSIVYATRPERLPALRAEAQTAAKLGLPAEFTSAVDLPYVVAGAVRFTDQAQFHPRRWLLGLADRLVALGGSIHPGVRATGLDEGEPCRVETTAGPVRARHVVVATHYPLFHRGLYFGRLSPRRHLVVAGPAPQQHPQAAYLDADTRHSVRTAPLNTGGRLLIVGGGHYRTGTASEIQRRYHELAAWARRALDLTTVTYHWSAHDMSTADGLPYIGRYHPFARHVWVATGFGAWGMTTGTLAGMILADLISGSGNPWASLYDPGRLSGAAVAGAVRDSAASTGLLVTSHTTTLGGPAVDELPPGGGTVIWQGIKPVAVCRDDDGAVHAVSARCTHLGCLVRWNDAERSWDCPCHGSRYDRDGTVLQGPAVRPLGRVEL